MELPLSELPAAAVVEVVKANWAAFYTHLGRAPGTELSVGPHLSWLLTGVPDAFLNVVFRADLPPDAGGAVVDEALRHFRSTEVARLSWWADSSGGDLGRLLVPRGLTFDASGTAMAADLPSTETDGPMPTGVEIVLVEDRAALRSWTQILCVGFAIPPTAERRVFELFAAVALERPMSTYLGLLDGRPVATSQSFVGAGVAGIYNVTCLPEARGRGIGAAVTRAPLLEARRQGLDLAILQASAMGYPVYRRLGFEDYGPLGTYQFRSDDPGIAHRGERTS